MEFQHLGMASTERLPLSYYFMGHETVLALFASGDEI